MGRGHGGTRGSGAGGGIPSDAAIAKMSQNWVPGKEIYVPNEPQMMSGEIVATEVYDYDKGVGQWTNARSPQIEADMNNAIGEAPVQPKKMSMASNKEKAKYLAAYDAYHEKYMAGMAHGVNEYKKLIGRTKNPALKSLLAHKVQEYQKFMSEAGGTKDWLHKVYRPRE